MSKKVRHTGAIYNHRLLWHAARCFRERAENEPEGSANQLWAASVFLYFALEAYVNHIGPHLAPDAWNDERAFFSTGKHRGTLGKVSYLLEVAGERVEKGRRPYQTIHELDRQRKSFAHARTELVDQTATFEDVSSMPTRVSPTLFGYADAAFVARAFEDVASVCDLLQAKAVKDHGEETVGGRFAFVGSAWIQGTSLES